MRAAAPWAALAATIIIWAGYLVVTRTAMKADLGPADVGLLRSLPAALILLPYTFRHGLCPQGARPLEIAAIAGIGGTAFIILLSAGLDFAPVADSGVFTPSMLPVFMAVLGVLFFAETRTPRQLLGLALIVTGALAIGGWSALANAQSGAWRGHILFLVASGFWAIYTLAFRASALDALAGTAIMVTWSTLLFLALAAATGLRLHTLPPSMLAIQIAQGIASGLVANLTFLYAVRRLGAVIPSAGAALVPILAAFGGWVFLAEPIGALKLAGIAVVATGILLASGIADPRAQADG